MLPAVVLPIKQSLENPTYTRHNGPFQQLVTAKHRLGGGGAYAVSVANSEPLVRKKVAS